MRILVLGCYGRTGLAVTRHLDRRHELFGGETRRKALAGLGWERVLRAPRVREVVRLPDPGEELAAFADAVAAECLRHGIDAVMPCDGASALGLSHRKRALEARSGAKLLVEDPERLGRVADKWRTRELCADLDIPTPRTVLPGAEPGETWRELAFPVVAKPRVADGARGVTFLDSESALEAFVAAPPVVPGNRPDGYPYLLQEHIAGELHDVTACAQEGRAISLLSQRRILSLYEFGGPGIINQTTHEPVILDYARRILERLRWNGPMLFDFIRDDAGRYFLLECNPRLWGTTELTLEAGLDVCQQLVDLYCSEQDLPAQSDYQVGMVYKWLVPECLGACFRSPRTPAAIASRLRCTLRRYGPGPTHTSLRRDGWRHLVGSMVDALARRLDARS